MKFEVRLISVDSKNIESSIFSTVFANDAKEAAERFVREYDISGRNEARKDSCIRISVQCNQLHAYPYPTTFDVYCEMKPTYTAFPICTNVANRKFEN